MVRSLVVPSKKIREGKNSYNVQLPQSNFHKICYKVDFDVLSPAK